MKKEILAMTIACAMASNAEAQIYSGDTWVQLPTVDLYDNDVMRMNMQVLAQTAALRRDNYYRYSDLAIDAFNERRWNSVIKYVNAALNTMYYSGALYYMRGYAFEQLGNLRAAKKDYKMGKKYNCREAAQALEDLKARNKRK